MTRSHCLICGRIFTPYHLKDKTCGRPDCQRQRAREARLEREAAEAGRKSWRTRKARGGDFQRCTGVW